MNEREIIKKFEEVYARDATRIIAGATTAKEIAEYFFRQGFNHGFDHALTPENRVVNYADSITSKTAARAI